MQKHTNIAVIESNWWRKSNTSVRGLFDLVANIAFDNPNAYHYEMVNTEDALKEVMPRIASYREVQYACIAAHGDKDGIVFDLSGQRITRTEIRNLLCKIKETNGSTLRGIHFSSCSFGTSGLAKHLFEKDVCINWVSGYEKDVSWIDSSALDLLFFNELLQGKKDEKPRDAIVRTAKRVKARASGLCKELGFGIFVKNSGSGLQNLLAGAEQ